MKKYNNLFDKIRKITNINKAITNATKNKKHYREVKQILKSRWRTVCTLYYKLSYKTYKVGKYIIYDLWSGNKWRTIYKVPMRDRIVQHAIMIFLEAIFRETFIPNTFQSIKGRGTHQCLKKIKKALKDVKNTLYCLMLDIHKCYPSLNKELLKRKLCKKFKDKLLLWLLFVIIDSCDKGVPIGNYTSQYFNNFYFSDLDHYCKEVLRIKYYFRYCDNIIILGETKEQLRYYYKKISEYINKQDVKLNDNWQIFPVDDRGIDAVGYIIFRNCVKLRKTTKINFIKACKSINFDKLTDRDVNVLGSYWGILRHADCRNLWFKYTNVKTFEDLHVTIHERKFIKEILNKEIIVNNVVFYNKRGEHRVKLIVDIDDEKDVYISTSAEMIIEATKQFTRNSYPFSTKIIETENGYYKFI